MDVSELRDAVSHIKATDEYKKKILNKMKDQAARSEAESGYTAAAEPEIMIPEKINHPERSIRRWSARSLALAASLAAVLIVAAAGIFFLSRQPLSGPSEKLARTAALENSENQADNNLMIAAETAAGASTYLSDGTSPDTAAADTKEPLLGMMLETGDAATAETAAGCAPSYFDEMNNSLLEIDGSAYYVTGDGRLFRYQAEDTGEELTTLPSGSVFTDGTYLYYSLAGRIIQTSVDGASYQVIFTADHDITLDYIDQDRLIFHDAIPEHLQYNYTVLERLSGDSHPLFENAADYAPAGAAETADDGSPAVYLSLLDISSEAAVFDISGGSWNAMYSVNLSTLAKTKIYDGLVLCAKEIGDTVYFAPDLSTAASSYMEAPQLWSVAVNGTNLTQIDLSDVSFDTLSWIAKSGGDLLLSTYSPDEKGGCVYLFRPASGKIALLEDKLGYIMNFFATDHYFTLFSQDPAEAGGDRTVTRKIIR